MPAMRELARACLRGREGKTYRTCGHMSSLHCLKLSQLLRTYRVHHVVTTHRHASGNVVAHLLCLGHHGLMLSLCLYRLQSLLLHVLGRNCRSTLALMYCRRERICAPCATHSSSGQVVDRTFAEPEGSSAA